MADRDGLVIEKCAGALGADVYGVDLSVPLAADIVAQIRQAFLDHLVVFFRDQTLTPTQFHSLAAYFGAPVEYPFVKGIDGHPQIIQVAKLEHEKVNFGGIWHSDTVYLETPPMGTLLQAQELPPYGGDTLFANQYLAYETLSEGMKSLLDSLAAIHSSAKADVSRTREDRRADSGRDDAKTDYVSEHPVVRTHPETGRKALYVNVAHTVRFSTMTEEESAPILQYLHAHQVKPEFTCRLVWQPGTIAFWDNRCTLHNPVNDYHGFRRVMHRITLAGDPPR